MSAVLSTTARTSPFDAAAFEQFLATRTEPDWVTDLRRRSFEAYRESLLTELDPEEWKRVDIRAFRPEKYHLQNASQVAEMGTLLADRTAFGGVVSHSDGSGTRSTLGDKWAALGVLFGNLTELVGTHGDVIRPSR